ESKRCPLGRIHSAPGLERSRRAWARQVVIGWEEPQLTQCTKKLGSVAARSASSWTLTSVPRYFPPESRPITPAEPSGAKLKPKLSAVYSWERDRAGPRSGTRESRLVNSRRK